jgi:uncharacterized protein (DUF433 family)
MQIEDYFMFLSPEDIRLKGTRIGIETILYEYIYRARTAEEIAGIYTSLQLEQVYATILYYLANKQQVTAYLEDWMAWSEQMLEEQRQNPDPLIQKLTKLKAELKAQRTDELTVFNR